MESTHAHDPSDTTAAAGAAATSVDLPRSSVGRAVRYRPSNEFADKVPPVDADGCVEAAIEHLNEETSVAHLRVSVEVKNGPPRTVLIKDAEFGHESGQWHWPVDPEAA